MNSLVVILSVIACAAAQLSGANPGGMNAYAPTSIAAPVDPPAAITSPTADATSGVPNKIKGFNPAHYLGKRSAPLIATAPVVSTYTAPIISSYAASPVVSTYATAPAAYTVPIARVATPIITSAYGVHHW